MSKMRMKAAALVTAIGVAFVLTAALLMGGSAPTRLPESDAGKFVLGLIYSGMTLLADQRIDQTERDRRFAQLIAENLDTPRIARFVLGRYWSPASDSEREEFIKVYPPYLARAFGTRIGQFAGAMVRVSGVRASGDEMRVVTVFEFLGPLPATAPASQMEIAWFVRATPDGFKIEDIDFQGISLKLQQRTSVMAIIGQMGETVAGLVRFILESLT